MTKTQTYFTILAAAVLIVAAGYIMNIGAVKSFSNLCLGFAQNNLLSVTAAVCAFVFLGRGNYWLLMTLCAVVTAVVIQMLILGQGAALEPLLARTVTFLGIVFLMNLVRLLINK
jgi:hypothetical protein